MKNPSLSRLLGKTTFATGRRRHASFLCPALEVDKRERLNRQLVPDSCVIMMETVRLSHHSLYCDFEECPNYLLVMHMVSMICSCIYMYMHAHDMHASIVLYEQARSLCILAQTTLELLPLPLVCHSLYQ